MFRMYSQVEPPEEFTDYLREHTAQADFRARRRSVLVRSIDGAWQLRCCTVKSFRDSTQGMREVPSRSYSFVLLCEEWLDGAEYAAFLKEVQTDSVVLGGITIKSTGQALWNVEHMPAGDFNMDTAGYMALRQFPQPQISLPQEPLFSPDAPFYPDLAEAGRDWLDLPIYHGDSDGRNGHIVFLVPEDRAYFGSAISGEGILQLSITGRSHRDRQLVVKGAYWEGSRLTHFDGVPTEGVFETAMPDAISRLEYALLDTAGTIYDYQYESGHRRSLLQRQRVGSEAEYLSDLVQQARRRGEGPHIEFKPLTELPNREKKKAHKYWELVKTALAFSNADGGRIYIGIGDNCELEGIGQRLAEWQKKEPDEALVDWYRGALLNMMVGDVDGELSIEILPIAIEGSTVLIVTVQESSQKPLVAKGDHVVYKRVGASNMQIPLSRLGKEMNWGSVTEASETYRGGHRPQRLGDTI